MIAAPPRCEGRKNPNSTGGCRGAARPLPSPDRPNRLKSRRASGRSLHPLTRQQRRDRNAHPHLASWEVLTSQPATISFRFSAWRRGGCTLNATTLAACGGGGGNATAKSLRPTTQAGGAATVGVASDNSLGKILAWDSQGRTIYLFQKDSTGKSACFGACAVAWPPVRVAGNPVVGTGLTASKVGTITRRTASRSYLRRTPALPLRRRPEGRPDQRPGHKRLRRELVRHVPGRERRHRQRLELRRQRWLLARRRGSARGAAAGKDRYS